MASQVVHVIDDDVDVRQSLAFRAIAPVVYRLPKFGFPRRVRRAFAVR